MSRRAHEAENVFAGARQFQRVERGGNRSAGMAGNVFKERRVAVKIFRHVEAREHFGRVGAEDLPVARASRRNPGERQFRLISQPPDRGGDPLRAFGMPGQRVAGAMFIGDDGHGKI